jgi:hypothetical protein
MSISEQALALRRGIGGECPLTVVVTFGQAPPLALADIADGIGIGDEWKLLLASEAARFGGTGRVPCPDDSIRGMTIDGPGALVLSAADG